MSHLRTLAAALMILGLDACHRAEQGQAPEAPSPGPLAPPAPPSPAAQKLLDQLPVAYRAADLKNGELHFNLCRACHTVAEGGPNMTGPNLYGVFGRQVAGKADFSYSAALAAKRWRWDVNHLDGWLKSPRAYVPGTKMAFYGIPDDQDRRDLIAYLKVVSSGGAI